MCLKLYDGFVPMYNYMYYIQTKSCVIPHSLVVGSRRCHAWVWTLVYILFNFIFIVNNATLCVCWVMIIYLSSPFSVLFPTVIGSLSPSLSLFLSVCLATLSLRRFLSITLCFSLSLPPLSLSLFFLSVPLSFSLPDLFPPSPSFHPLFIHLSVRYSTTVY